ncbi:MAG: pseudouridine synthase, partial [Pirellulales bacterium]
MRKLKPGEWVEVFEQSLPKPPDAEDVVIHHVDRDLVVLEKPSGMVTLRHPAEINWSTERTKVQPVLEEVIPELIYRRQISGNSPLLSVHRIDRGTSGLLV